MSLDLRTWKAVYNLFNPTARLEAWDQDLFVPRAGSVTDDIAGDLRAGLEPEAKWVVCGSMGSGKSSELVHLATELRHSHGIIALDLPNSVARIERIQPAEVLFLIGAAALRALAESPGSNPDEAAEKELVRAFHGLLAEDASSVNIPDILKGVALFAANLAAPGAGAVVGAATGAAQVAAGAVGNRKLAPRRTGQLGGRTRQVQDGEPELERLREAVDAILKGFAAYKPPVVLVDGLDKIQDISAIRGLFSATRVLSEPRAPVVYSGPITLMSAEWQAAGGVFKRVRLANVVVHEPELPWLELPGDKVEQGRETMRQVVRARLAREHLKADDVFAVGSLDLLVNASGGLMRDLVHLVNRAIWQSIVREAGIVDLDCARAAFEDFRKEYEITLNTQRVDELRHVRRTGEPSGREDVSIDLLLNGYVLPYSNGRTWFSPHPILRGLRDGL